MAAQGQGGVVAPVAQIDYEQEYNSLMAENQRLEQENTILKTENATLKTENATLKAQTPNPQQPTNQPATGMTMLDNEIHIVGSLNWLEGAIQLKEIRVQTNGIIATIPILLNSNTSTLGLVNDSKANNTKNLFHFLDVFKSELKFSYRDSVNNNGKETSQTTDLSAPSTPFNAPWRLKYNNTLGAMARKGANVATQAVTFGKRTAMSGWVDSIANYIDLNTVVINDTDGSWRFSGKERSRTMVSILNSIFNYKINSYSQAAGLYDSLSSVGKLGIDTDSKTNGGGLTNVQWLLYMSYKQMKNATTENDPNSPVQNKTYAVIADSYEKCEKTRTKCSQLTATSDERKIYTYVYNGSERTSLGIASGLGNLSRGVGRVGREILQLRRGGNQTKKLSNNSHNKTRRYR